jgi:hypothetical protein
MAPRGLFDRPMIEEGSKGKTSPALLFGVVAATVIALLTSFRKPRRNHTGAFANVLGSSVQGRGATLFHLNNDCGVHWFLV